MASEDQLSLSEEISRKPAVSLQPLSIPAKPNCFNSITAFRAGDDEAEDEEYEQDGGEIDSTSALEIISSYSRADRPSPSRLKSASLSSVSFSPLTSARGRRVAENRHVPVDRNQSKDTDFLTVLATQERHVLELKEELQEAEHQLESLKQHWARHESTKKRQEGRNTQRLRTLSTSATRPTDQSDDFDGSSAWMYEEMERRKALLGNSRNSSRRVFSGSRHTRTLSLVASNTPTESGVLIQTGKRAEGVKHSQHLSLDASSQSSAALPERPRRTTLFSGEIPNLQHENLMRTGRQVATGLKDGLWTLLEDIKQATVGDEARSTHQPTPRRVSSRENSTTGKNSGHTVDICNSPKSGSVKEILRSKKASDNNSELESNFWRENGIGEIPGKAVARTPQKVRLHTKFVDGEAWDTWDTPQYKMSPAPSSKSNSPIQSQSSPTPSRSSPSTSRSNSLDGKEARVSQHASNKSREAIPWPALTKLAPGHLRRTASHLMEEWERSLTAGGINPKKDSSQPDDSADRDAIEASRLHMRFD